MAKNDAVVDVTTEGVVVSSAKTKIEPAKIEPLETLEALVERLNPPAYLVAAAKQRHGWVAGQELRAAGFEQALNDVQNEVLR
jgi:hypothetical protein